MYNSRLLPVSGRDKPKFLERMHTPLGCVGLIAVFASLLGGCSAGTNAVVQSVRQVIQPGSSESTRFDPKFAYLRITRGRHTGFLWRGNTERAEGGPVEVYYSGSGEVVRLQNGRIVGALGLETEWRGVTVTPLSWSAVAANVQPTRFVRVRDVMPGYRTGIRDELVLRRIAPPERSGLRGIDPKSLTWFEETAQHPVPLIRLRATRAEELPTARYAVDLTGEAEAVVYAEQCLSADLCFAWQRWSAAMQSAAARAP
jgi:hypothetical protein